jgi:2-aminoadipate transaminase
VEICWTDQFAARTRRMRGSAIRELLKVTERPGFISLTFDQMIAYELLRSGFLESHKSAIVQTYRERRDAMVDALSHSFPRGTRWTQPEGGMFLWVELPQSIDAADLLRRAMEQRVAFVPGGGFHVDRSGHNTMRLNFSNSTPDQITEGIVRLARELQGMECMADDSAVDVRDEPILSGAGRASP